MKFLFDLVKVSLLAVPAKAGSGTSERERAALLHSFFKFPAAAGDGIIIRV